MISVTQSEFGIEPPITRKPETRWGVKKIRGCDVEGEPSKRVIAANSQLCSAPEPSI
jgi:hypothetical protein